MKTLLIFASATLMLAAPAFAGDKKEDNDHDNPTMVAIPQAYQVLNAQTNTGAITSTVKYADAAPIIKDLNASSVVLNNNVVRAYAHGNIAENSINVSAPFNMPVLVTNTQTNAGRVTATVTGAHFGVGIDAGIVTKSSISYTGNQIVAVAVGNIASVVLGN